MRRPLRLRAPLPPGYPVLLERRVTLADHRHVHVRPLVPDDTAALKEAIEQADEDTIRRRFLGGRRPTDAETLRYLTTLDYDRRLAIVAFDCSGQGVAVARYEGDPDTDLAEVAVAVDPGWRRVGLATELLRLLAHAALERGIPRFTASYLADNIDVRSLLEDSHLPHERSRASNVIEEVVRLDDELLARTPDAAPVPWSWDRTSGLVWTVISGLAEAWIGGWVKVGKHVLRRGRRWMR